MKIIIGIFAAIRLMYLTNAHLIAPVEPQPPIVCPCDYKYNPVCGSDGVTYMNKCVLECTSCANVKLGLPAISCAEECECRGGCNCQNVDLPVCTLAGQTYPNECVLACENIKRIANNQSIVYLAYRTACRGVPGDCTDIAVPVCGTDNVLYRNKCVLDYVNTFNSEAGLLPLTVKNNGACPGGFLCPITEQPVCANDGNIYRNPCELEAENESKKWSEIKVYLYKTDPSVCEACHCSDDREPFCATDGNTYINLCKLKCEIRKQNDSNLKALYKGVCQKCECKDIYYPVCGTDQKTYNNRCLLDCESIGRSEDLPALKVFHIGQCQDTPCDCSNCNYNESDQPMCGTDGQTYQNLCWLECIDRCKQKNGRDAVFLSKRGYC